MHLFKSDSTRTFKFKVQVHREGEEDSLEEKRNRRVEVEGSNEVLYARLKEALMKALKLAENAFRICYKDEENDVVDIESNDELLIALKVLKGPIFKIFIQIKKSENSGKCTTIFQVLYLYLKNIQT